MADPVASLPALTHCRACGSKTLTELLTLGQQLVSDFVPADRVTRGHCVPITLVQCISCTLVQQKYTAPQDFMYTRHYWYRSGTTQTMRDALEDVVYSALKRVQLEKGDIVLDIGSNDGTLLRAYPNCGVIRVGVEPATNLQEEGKNGVDLLINDFWSFDSYQEHLLDNCVDRDDYRNNIRAKIVTACGMFYDLPDPNQFIGDIAKVLHPDGVFVAQLMCARQTYQLGDAGNLAHEHLEFYTLMSLRYLFAKHGLKICDIEENNVNGGSYRLYVKHESAKVSQSELDRVEAAFAAESPLLVAETWRGWYERVRSNRDLCVNFIHREVDAGKTVWVYGASTKGNVILQWYGLDSNVIQGACDKSPEKQGLFTVGTGIPIVSESAMRAKNPDYCLLLPYTFLDEFVRRETVWRSGGGKFIVPLPSFRIV